MEMVSLAGALPIVETATGFGWIKMEIALSIVTILLLLTLFSVVSSKFISNQVEL